MDYNHEKLFKPFLWIPESLRPTLAVETEGILECSVTAQTEENHGSCLVIEGVMLIDVSYQYRGCF